MIMYDLYKRPNGMLYRVDLARPIHFRAEVFFPKLNRWIPSSHKIGGVLSSPRSSLVARNVVFKASLC